MNGQGLDITFEAMQAMGKDLLPKLCTRRPPGAVDRPVATGPMPTGGSRRTAWSRHGYDARTGRAPRPWRGARPVPAGERHAIRRQDRTGLAAHK
ncbi:hypothetical protein OG306_15875 [Streptomyces sp. NBC_01241]|uniref:hypothetical protein n=1 Tax=Streptomyces sp. NBC_01241 TaxID=2903794 RepID=UPI00352D870E|nr:hypothetical protein OG306_15875 [Streptomyces sp. NBC_01241]